MNYYGQLDLTKAGIIARRHPELVKKVKFSDGIEHMLLNVSIFDLQKPDKNGNTVTLKVRCKKEDQVEALKKVRNDVNKEIKKKYHLK